MEGAHFAVALLVTIGIGVGSLFFGVVDVMVMFDLFAATFLGVSFHLYITEGVYLRSE